MKSFPVLPRGTWTRTEADSTSLVSHTVCKLNVRVVEFSYCLLADKCRVILVGEQPDYIHAVFAHVS